MSDEVDAVAASKSSRYALSFTSGALLVREALVAAPIYLEERDWSRVRARLREGNLLQARTRSTGFRLAREVAQRLEVLTVAEIDLLIESAPAERGYLMWVAACRRYAFIGDFAKEVLRERYLVLASTVDYADFDSFVHGKSIWHEELAELKDSTLQKLRSTVFRMLVEASLLDERRTIIPAVFSKRLAELLDDRKPSDIRFFPVGGAVR